MSSNLPLLTIPWISFWMYFVAFLRIQEVRARWHKLESPIHTYNYFCFQKKFGLWKKICHETLKMAQIREKFELRVTFRKTDTPEIHHPLWFGWFLAQVCIMTRNASPQNFRFLAHLLSKLQHLRKCFNFRSNCGFYDQRIFKWHSHIIVAYSRQFSL